MGAGSALALPFLPSLHAHAGPRSFPKRFIFVFTANGQRTANWYPPVEPEWNTLAEHVRSASLVDLPPSKAMEGGLDKHRDKLTLFRGLDIMDPGGGGHEVHAPLSGFRASKAGVTIDQVLARSSKVYPEAPMHRAVHQLIKPKDQQASTVSVANVGGIFEEVESQTSPKVVFDQLFGAMIDEGVDPLVAQRKELKRGVIDRVRGQYDALVKNPKLSGDDKKRLTAHAELLHDLHARLGSEASNKCVKPPAPAEFEATNANLEEITHQHIDILAAAIKCDLTRVSTLMLGAGTDLQTFSFLQGGPLPGHHQMSHDKNATENLGLANRYFGQKLARLLEQLDEVEDEETGRTFLDNSLVYWGNEDGCNDFDSHKSSAMPVLLAGSCGGAISTGRYMDYRRLGESVLYDAKGQPGNSPTDYRGRPYNSLLISILQAFGLEPSEYEQGSPGFGDYSVNLFDQYDMNEASQPLPFLA